MFSTHERLQKRTPANGIDRREYIRLLVDEYYETTDIEAQQQVTANLANFAYDPINYQFLKDASAIDLFIQLLASPNPQLQLHGSAGICNIVADPESQQKIIDLNGFQPLIALLKHTEIGIVFNVLATLLQLDGVDTRNHIHTPELQATLRSLRDSSNVTVKNYATVLTTQITPAAT